MSRDNDFNPQSTNAMFATILAKIEEQARNREAFSMEVMKRFDEGTDRMERIEVQTTKTNGRVTRLEQGWRIVTAKAAGAIAVVWVVVQVALWIYERGGRLTTPGP